MMTFLGTRKLMVWEGGMNGGRRNGREEGRAYEAGGPLLVGADGALPHKRSLVLVIAAWVVGKRSL